MNDGEKPVSEFGGGSWEEGRGGAGLNMELEKNIGAPKNVLNKQM